MATFPGTGASCYTTFDCMKSDIQTQLNKNISLSDSDTKNGGFLDLSGSKETRECKAI